MFRSALSVAAVLFAFAWGAPAQASVLEDALRLQLMAGEFALGDEEREQDLVLLSRFYGDRDMAPVWVTEQGPRPLAASAARQLAEAGEDGLEPEDYGASAASALLESRSPEQLAELEVLLSLGILRLASDLTAGRVEPNKVDPEHYIYPIDVDRPALLDAMAATPNLADFVAGFRPDTDEYLRLRAAYAMYLELAERGGWDPVPPGGTLDPGMTDPRVPTLRARLRVTADLVEAGEPAADGDPMLYDEALAAALRRFQARHGLEEDGRVGPNTLEALNVTAGERAAQIALNMERRRWMPDALGQRYVFVNLADFWLKVVDEPHTVFTSRVVVGTSFHRTPVFSEAMTYIVLNPYWNVPPSIARNELLPKLRKDPGYLASNNFELFEGWGAEAGTLDATLIDWSSTSPRSFPYKIRQRPGPGNALGRVKFMLPNRHNIYLHDTPSRSLFQRTQRDFSHGCVRVHQPLELAELILGWQGWDMARIEQIVASGQQTIVTLGRALPVHFTYLTAWVNKDGTVHFRRDVYGRDERLARALQGAGERI